MNSIRMDYRGERFIFSSAKVNRPLGSFSRKTPAKHIFLQHFLYYHLYGERDLNLWGERFTIAPGSVTLFYKNRSYITYPPAGSYGAINILFSSLEGDCLFPEKGEGNIKEYEHGGNFKELFIQVQRYKQESRKVNDRSDYMAVQSLKLILGELIKEGEKKPCEKEGMGFLIERIRDNPAGTVTLEQAAGECFMSVSTFKRHFRSEQGKTFGQFQKEEKTKQACLLLAEEARSPLKWIANELGFCDEYYFSRVFKQIEGISPGRYREMLLRGL